MPLRDLRTPRQVAVQRIGHWPGLYSSRAARGARAASGLRTAQSGSSAHAAAVWNETRELVARRAPGLEKGAGGYGAAGGPGRLRLPGLVDLEFVGQLAAHVVGCRRCGVRGAGSDTPEQWLTWAVGRRRNLREILGPVLESVAGGGGFSGDPPGLREWARGREAARERREAVRVR